MTNDWSSLVPYCRTQIRRTERQDLPPTRVQSQRVSWQYTYARKGPSIALACYITQLLCWTANIVFVCSFADFLRFPVFLITIPIRAICDGNHNIFKRSCLQSHISPSYNLSYYTILNIASYKDFALIGHALQELRLFVETDIQNCQFSWFIKHVTILSKLKA